MFIVILNMFKVVTKNNILNGSKTVKWCNHKVKMYQIFFNTPWMDFSVHKIIIKNITNAYKLQKLKTNLT